MLIRTWFAAISMLLFIAVGTLSADDAGIPDSIPQPPGHLTRYPPRLPDWLWTRAEYEAYVSAADREEIVNLITELEVLRTRKKDSGPAWDRKEEEVSRRIAMMFTVRDFAAGQKVYSHKKEGVSYCAFIDPKFSPESTKTIERALTLYVQVAADPDVIQRAWEASTDKPMPQPDRYEMKDGKEVVDAFGNKVHSGSFKLLSASRTRPPSPEYVRKQIKELFPSSEEPGLLVIGQCRGTPWWGSGYYSYANKECFRLSREAPSRGFGYICLHEDKMEKSVADFDNPAHWAGKIGHEVLHNLGYWHPSYKDPADRDRHNQGKEQAFIVSYERAVIEAAGKLLEVKKD